MSKIRMLRIGTAMVALALSLPAAAAGTLDEIKRTKTFKIAYRADAPPFSSVSDGGDPQGFSVDLCRIIADHIKTAIGLEDMKIEYVQVTADNRLAAITEGRAHIECGVTTNTLSRQKIVDFSNLTYVTGGSLMTTADSGIRSASELSGKRVAVVENTTTQAAIEKFLTDSVIDADLKLVKSHSEAMALLKGGEVDAVAGDRATLFGSPTTCSPTSRTRFRCDATTPTSASRSIARCPTSIAAARSVVSGRNGSARSASSRRGCCSCSTV
jgi:ABC-type amino acid transport substrate-binding protein